MRPFEPSVLPASLPHAGCIARAVLGLAATAALSGCLATTPTMGENKGTVSGAAGGATTEGGNAALEHCDDTLGTMALQDDNGGSNQRPIDDAPIVYSGGYGLFPVGE